VFEVMAAYNAGVPRESLDAVRRVRERVGSSASPRRVVVVGTNGKTSTAAYLSRLLRGAGHSTGLYTSPHLREWTERIQVDGAPVSRDEFTRALSRVHEIASGLVASERPGDLRFFDVLTLAADQVFGSADVEFGVFEAGIGGRLDATRVLEPELVVLTSIGADHEALLGASAVSRLREKALATPPGGVLLSAPLGDELEAELARVASGGGFTAEVIDRVDGASVQEENLALARSAAARVLGEEALPAIDTEVAGRSQRGVIDGVPYVLDVAHNPTAWRAFLDELPDEPHVAVVAVTLPRPGESFVDVVAERGRAKLATVIATSTSVRPTQPPDELASLLAAADIDAHAVAEPRAAFDDALRAAQADSRPLAVFGSNFLVVDFLAWKAGCRPTQAF
jgi:dihydrofolate synthase/folylpolyglutamate synthase